jgi:hypothetical protein
MGKIVISESERKSILGLYGLISESDDVISRYVTEPRIVSILKQIETTLGEKFNDQHFKTEIQFSGNLKQESGGLLPEVVKAFNKMKNESGCSDIFIKDGGVSYRSYEDQKTQFLQEAAKYSQDKINNALKRVAIPGFSQHHTGKSIDYGGNTICLRKNVWPNGDFNTPNKWGFTLPYMSGVKRMEESWHLYYVGLPNQKQDTNTIISITSNDLIDFGNQISTQTMGQSLDLDSFIFKIHDRKFSINKGGTQVLKIVLRWSEQGEDRCISCDNTISKNPEHNPKRLISGTFKLPNDVNERLYSLIVLYPKK